MLISYIIVSFNSRPYLPDCLDSIMADAPADAEIIVIDNASHDGVCDLLGQQYPSVRLIKNDRNVGHCPATNQGFRAARGHFIMLLDADTKLEPETTSTLLDFLERHPQVKAVAPRMLNPDSTIQETARNFPSIINALWGRQTLLARLFPNNRFTTAYLARENLAQSEPFPVDWVSAACMVFPRSTVDEVGEWDEGYGGYWVDADWCKRIQNGGGPIYCIPEARVWHFEQNRPGRKRSLSRIRLFNQGAHRFFTKHHTWGPWDPRALAAGGLLSLRTIIQATQNLFASEDKKPNET